MTVFEFISEEDFKTATLPQDQAPGETASSRGEVIPLDPVSEEPEPDTLTWCDFCKGYYIEEYHVERRQA